MVQRDRPVLEDQCLLVQVGLAHPLRQCRLVARWLHLLHRCHRYHLRLLDLGDLEGLLVLLVQ